MRHGYFQPQSLKLYSATATISVFMLFLALIHKGTDGPFGPTLDQLSSEQLIQGAGSDVFEIVYFGNADCDQCADWKREHLPHWRKAVLSREVRFTMRSASCGTANKYASLCRKLMDGSEDRPVFALIHWESGRVLATGEGVSGFYSVGRQARKWHKSLSGWDTAA